jgi:hypothetical protein
MVCRTSCLISLAFIIGYIVFSLNADKTALARAFQKSLPGALQKIYRNIVDERKKLNIHGYLLGLLLAALLLVVDHYFLKTRTPTGRWGLICFIAAVTFLTQYFYYILSPKSDWMVRHLSSSAHREAWLKVYRAYQLSYHGGIAIGILGALIAAYAFKCQ